MQITENICLCCMDERKRRHRDFSPQIWALLLSWQEVPPEAVDQPMCNGCYEDIRGILIERAYEVESALASGTFPDPQTFIETYQKNSDQKRKGKKGEKVSKIAS